MESVFLTLGAFRLCVGNGITDEEKDQEQYNHHSEYGEQFFTFLVRLRGFPSVVVGQVGVHGTYALHHAFVPFPMAEQGKHGALLYALADGVGQVSFDAISCDELHAPFATHQQDDKTVVGFLLAHTVLFTQLVGKLEAIATFNLLHGHHQCFDTRLLLQLIENLIHRAHRLCRQDAVGVAHVACLVLQMHHGHLFHLVLFGHQGEGSDQHQGHHDIGDYSFHFCFVCIIHEAKLRKDCISYKEKRKNVRKKEIRLPTLCYCHGDGSSLPRRWQYTASMVADVCQRRWQR